MQLAKGAPTEDHQGDNSHDQILGLRGSRDQRKTVHKKVFVPGIGKNPGMVQSGNLMSVPPRIPENRSRAAKILE
jgi:hypothetical protein